MADISQNIAVRDFHYGADYECLCDVMEDNALILIRANSSDQDYTNSPVFYTGKNDGVPEGFHAVNSIDELTGKEFYN